MMPWSSERRLISGAGYAVLGAVVALTIAQISTVVSVGVIHWEAVSAVLIGIGSLATAWAAYAAQEATRVSLALHGDSVARVSRLEYKRAVAWAVALDKEAKLNIEMMRVLSRYLREIEKTLTGQDVDGQHTKSADPHTAFAYASDVVTELNFSILQDAPQYADNFDVYTSTVLIWSYGASTWIERSPKWAEKIHDDQAVRALLDIQERVRITRFALAFMRRALLPYRNVAFRMSPLGKWGNTTYWSEHGPKNQ
jgi:hypothetical protein